MARKIVLPDDEEKPFVVRWNLLVRVLLVETSVKAVAWAAMTFASAYDGSEARPSIERLERNTGLSKNTVRKAWATLAGCGMAEVVDQSHWNGRFRTANEYRLAIPDHWRGLATLGPHEGKFRCTFCHHGYNPPPVASLHEDGTVRWKIAQSVFCNDKCRASWDRAEVKARRELPWGSQEAWSLFRRARDDDWPQALSAAA